MTVFSVVIIIILLLVIIGLLLKKQRPVHVRLKPPLWNGPEPTEAETQETQQWLIEYFKEYPSSTIQNNFPDLYNTAMASKRYDELEYLRKNGMIDEIDYQLELEKILPLIQLPS